LKQKCVYHFCFEIVSWNVALSGWRLTIGGSLIVNMII